MSETDFTKPPLGVGALIGETFGIFFRNFIPVLLAAFVPYLLATLANAALLGFGPATGQTPADPSEFDMVAFPVSWIVGSIATGVGIAVIVQIAYGAKVGYSVPLGAAFAVALRSIVPIAVLSVVVTILTSIAMVALILPGIYLWARWSVVVPAIVVEGAGFSAMQRSAVLTKEYRWPVIGALVLFGIILLVLTLAMAPLVAYAATAAGMLVALVLQALLSSIPWALLCILIGLLYARLREIKEGVSVEAIVDVFT